MAGDIETRLRGTRLRDIAQEFFTNSAHFPIANIIFELLVEGPAEYFTKPDFYVITAAAAAQSTFLGSRQYAGRSRPLLGSLIGPALYTLVEGAIEGAGDFFASPSHIAYWIFSLVIGFLQELRLHLSGKPAEALTLLENLARTSILLAMYWLFEAVTEPQKYSTLAGFLADPSHVFIVTVILLLGLMVGFAHVTALSYLTILRQTASQLRLYSEWLFGRDLLSRAVTDPASLSLRRRERTVLFMDIRGFTQWSETQPPEKVVAMLNAYFEAAERVWSDSSAIKTKFTGDEVMIVFPTERAAAEAALELRRQIGPYLKQYRLSAGIGLHSGPLVEGLLGSKEVKGYDVIGDTVNTAQRLCDAAAGGEILISQAVFAALGRPASVLEPRQIMVKGKSEPLIVYPLQELRDEAQLDTTSSA